MYLFCSRPQEQFQETEKLLFLKIFSGFVLI